MVVASSTPYSHAYSYSPIGNISSSTPSGAYAYSETGYANPHTPTSIGGTSLTYDNNGNVIAHGSQAYTWDYRNRVTEAGTGSATSTYAYDHTIERVKKAIGGVTTVYPKLLCSSHKHFIYYAIGVS